MSRLAEAVCTAGLGEYKEMRFRAYEQDDHILILEHEGQIIGEFNATSTTIEVLQATCHQHLNEDIFRKLNDDQQPVY